MVSFIRNYATIHALTDPGQLLYADDDGMGGGGGGGGGWCAVIAAKQLCIQITNTSSHHCMTCMYIKSWDGLVYASHISAILLCLYVCSLLEVNSHPFFFPT